MQMVTGRYHSQSLKNGGMQMEVRLPSGLSIKITRCTVPRISNRDMTCGVWSFAGKAARKSETQAGVIDLVHCKDIRTSDGKLFLDVEGRTYGQTVAWTRPGLAPSTHDIASCFKLLRVCVAIFPVVGQI